MSVSTTEFLALKIRLEIVENERKLEKTKVILENKEMKERKPISSILICLDWWLCGR